ncbi:MAG: metallophosphoesterase [Polyangiaceae bacterium]|nr:metallophosphoesterase [Polyangiaceae bacterium]
MNLGRLILALVVMAAFLALLNFLLWRRSSVTFGLKTKGRRALAIALGAPFAATLFFRGLGSKLPMDFGRPLAVAASSAELGVAIAASFIGLFLGIRWAAERITKQARGAKNESASGAVYTKEASFGSEKNDKTEAAIAPETNAAAAPETRVKDLAPALSRRTFVEQAAFGSAAFVGGSSAVYGSIFGRRDYEVTTVPMPVPGLSKAADGFTIVQLSDIHLGQMVGEVEARIAEDLVRNAKGNLIVLTGDLIDHDVRYTTALGTLVRRLSAIAPVVAIPGNHDHYTGVDAVLETVRAAGGTTLMNQSAFPLGKKSGFALLGVDDLWAEKLGGGPDLEAAVAHAQSDLPRILLCHNPKVFVETAGKVAVQLSGHTHGGQVNIGLRPADLVLRHGYIAGLYETNGSRIYVNRGFGTAGPAARVGAPPEVSRIVLVSA